ncbi:MAG: hypothetical protein R2867_44230 [Caldilineaceae bacterium]
MLGYLLLQGKRRNGQWRLTNIVLYRQPLPLGSILLVVGAGFSLGSTVIPQERLPFVYLAMLICPSVAGLRATGLVDGGAGVRSLLSRLARWRVGGGISMSRIFPKGGSL